MFDNRCGRGEGAVSIGTHYNIGVTGKTWQEICSGRFPAVTGFYASAIAGIQLVAGLGCVGSANGRPHVDYQISQVDLAFATGTLLGASRVQWEPLDPRTEADHFGDTLHDETATQSDTGW